jgi:hypothetical protein
MDTPTRLYKYLPSKFVQQFVERGNLLFRNLSYFRQIEERGRADFREGLHVDYPDNDITIQTLDGRVNWKGRAKFLNSIDPNRVFIFCLSEIFSPMLYAEFNTDTCVEILDPKKFLKRCNNIMFRQPRFSGSVLLHDRVEYYAPNKAVVRNVKDPRLIPFFKHETYLHQQEYRLAALHHGLQLTQRIVKERFTFDEEVTAGTPAKKHVCIGSISDIVKVHRLGSHE